MKKSILFLFTLITFSGYASEKPVFQDYATLKNSFTKQSESLKNTGSEKLALLLIDVVNFENTNVELNKIANKQLLIDSDISQSESVTINSLKNRIDTLLAAFELYNNIIDPDSTYVHKDEFENNYYALQKAMYESLSMAILNCSKKDFMAYFHYYDENNGEY